MTLVYANIAISWQLLRFNSLKKHFPQIYRFKRFENGLGKKVPWFEIFSLILAENPCFSLISLTGKSLQIFPWIPWFPWSVGTLYIVCERLSVMQWQAPVGLICVRKSQFTLFSPENPPPMKSCQIWGTLDGFSCPEYPSPRKWKVVRFENPPKGRFRELVCRD